MKRVVPGFVAAFALASSVFLSPGVQAADIHRTSVMDISLGTTSLQGIFNAADSGKTFSDFFSFSIGSGSDFDAALTSVATLTKFDLDITGLKLFSGRDLLSVGTRELSGKHDMWTLSHGGLTNGDYGLVVEGIVLGTNGGSYGGNLNVSPVPEPGTLGMMAGGLALLGFIGRRRKANGIDA